MNSREGNPFYDRGEVVRRLRHLIPSLERAGPARSVGATFTVPEIDGLLPGGGLLRGVLHEAAPARSEDFFAALGFAVALLGRSLAEGGGSLLIVVSGRALAPRGCLYGPGLAHLGLTPDRLALVETKTDTDALWALEEGLRAGAVKGLVGVIGKPLDLKASRRLQLAAAASDTLFLLLRPSDGEGASAATTRWRVASEPGALDRFGCFGPPRWRVALERNRGGRGGGWSLEWDHGAHRFGLVGTMADRALPEGARTERERVRHRF